MSAYSDLILADSPGAYWRLGEASGNFADATAGAHTATRVGGTLGVTGALAGDADTAFRMAQTAGDGGFAADHADLKPSGAVSLEAWVKYTGSPSGFSSIIRKGESGNSWWIRRNSDQTLSCRVYTAGGGVDVFTGTLNDDAWHHIVGTYDGSNVRIYVDGGLVGGPTAQTGSITYDTAVVGIGSDGNWFSGPWIGDLDEAAIYPTALSGSAILAHYNTGIGAGGSSDPLGMSGFFGQ